jgi:signal transduction histidine kinase
MLMILINLLNHSGIIDITGSSLEQYGVATGYVSEAIILTFGLAYKFNSYRVEKEQLALAFQVQQKENAKALVDTEIAERRNIADELHDIAGSMLSAARLNLASVKEKSFTADRDARAQLEKADEALAVISNAVRNLSHALSPVMLDKVGFKKSILNIVSFFNTSGKINIEVVIIGFETYDPKLENIYTILYSIVYELLNNTAKHSQAANAILQLIEHDHSVVLMAEDNGKGLSEQFDKKTTRGLAGITSKINYFNGSIQFDNLQQGLAITIEIPKESYETKDRNR